MAVTLVDKRVGNMYPLVYAGNGSSVTVTDNGRRFPGSSGTPQYVRTDWQGTSLLYSTARTNLAIQSQDFDNASWGKLAFAGTGVAAVVTPNAGIAPDGTLTADQVVFNAGAGTTSGDFSQITQNMTVVTSSNYTGSFWVKGTAGDKIVFRHAGASTFTVVNITGSWQRVAVTENALGVGCVFTIGIRQGVVGTINATATVLLWGAQLELGTSATSYIPTTTGTVAVTDYTLSNGVITLAQTTNPAVQQRVVTNSGSGDGVTTAFLVSPGGTPTVTALYKTDWQGTQLLYSTARTNVQTRSQDLSTGWGLTAATLSTATTAPDGTTSLQAIVEDGTTGIHAITGPTATISAATSYRFSVFFKAREMTKVLFSCTGAGLPSTAVSVDLVAGTAVSALGSPTSIEIVNLGGGLYWVAFRVVSTGVAGAIVFYTTTDGVWANRSHAGTSGNGVYAWGAMISAEGGSYIPTVASQVTVTDYTLATNTATLSPAPAVGSVVSWSGSYVGGIGVTTSIGRKKFDQVGKNI